MSLRITFACSFISKSPIVGTRMSNQSSIIVENTSRKENLQKENCILIANNLWIQLQEFILNEGNMILTDNVTYT